MAIEYYSKLYSMDDVEEEVDRLAPEGFEELTTRELTDLNKPFTNLEVEYSVRSMGSFKAPSPDGYQPIFLSRLLGCGGRICDKICVALF